MGLARIADFKDRLGAIRPEDLSRVWSVALNELRHLKTASWTPAGAEDSVQGYATTTLRSVLSDYRNAVREDERFGPDHPVLAYLRPSLTDQQAVRAESLDAVLERGAKENRRAIDPEDLVDTAMRLLDEPEDGNRLPLKTAGLLLLTGRRTIELFRGELVAPPREFARDALLDGARGATLVFGGQAKSRSEERTAYEIPVLGDPARILRAFQELQREYPAISELEAKFPNLGDRDINKKLDGKVASRLGDYVRDAFSDNRGGTLTPKDLRAVYAATAWDWYAREQSPQPSFNAFAARALGHGEKDVGTALSYQQFYVVGASRTFDRAYRRANVQSAVLLDAEARTEGDDRRRGFIEENAYRFRTAAGVEAPSIDLPDSKKAADVTDATEQTKTNALRIQYAQEPELREQEGEVSTLPPGPTIERPSGASHLYAVEELTTGTLFDRVSEIAMGLSCEAFTADERRAALAIRNAAAGLDRDDLVVLLADPREMLGNADALVAQINEIGLRAPSKQRESGIGR